MQISVLNNSFKLCCIIALFFNRSFQFLKSLFADGMFYPTGITFCGFLINPDSYKLRGDTKAVLRTAANKTLPDAWANRTKKGFPVPIAKWLEDPAFSAKVRKSFTSDVAAEYFDQDKLVAMLADPKHERRKIWTAYTFLTWHEQFFEKFDA